MDAQTEARVRELAREEIRAAAQTPAPVQPVAPRELTEAERMAHDLDAERAHCGKLQARLATADRLAKALEAERDALRAQVDVIRARPPAVPQPAPSATVDEVIAAVVVQHDEVWINRLVNTDRLRAALSTLSPAQLRGMVDAIDNERK